MLKECLKRHAPLWRVQVTRPPAPWMDDSQILSLQQLRNKFRKEAHQTGSQESWELFWDVRKKLKAAIHRARETFTRPALSTIVFLKIGDSIHTAFTKRELPVCEREKCAWLPITFLRLWKAWLKIEEYPVENHFITGQTYDDIILAGHCIIISMKLFAIYYPTLPYEPWMFGSDSCEVLFSSPRGFCRGNPNLTLMDIMDFARRI